MLIDNINNFNLIIAKMDTNFNIITKTTTFESSFFYNLNYYIYYTFFYYSIKYLFLSDFGLYIINSNNSLYLYTYFIYNYSFNYSIKFLISILILIFIRAGIPRYRYDFLTKLG